MRGSLPAIAVILAVAVLVLLWRQFGQPVAPVPEDTWERTVEVGVDIDRADDGALSFRIDKAHHQTAVVSTGDRVRWTCNCPEGTEFRAQDFEYVADVDEVFDFYHRFARIDAGTVSTEPPSDPAEFRREWEGMATRLNSLLAEIKMPLEGAPRLAEPAAGPFAGVPTDEFAPHDGSLLTEPLVRFEGTHLWKFTWVVRPAGNEDPESWSVWDPHLVGHGRRGG